MRLDSVNRVGMYWGSLTNVKKLYPCLLFKSFNPIFCLFVFTVSLFFILFLLCSLGIELSINKDSENNKQIFTTTTTTTTTVVTTVVTFRQYDVNYDLRNVSNIDSIRSLTTLSLNYINSLDSK